MQKCRGNVIPYYKSLPQGYQKSAVKTHGSVSFDGIYTFLKRFGERDVFVNPSAFQRNQAVPLLAKWIPPPNLAARGVLTHFRN